MQQYICLIGTYWSFSHICSVLSALQTILVNPRGAGLEKQNAHVSYKTHKPPYMINAATRAVAHKWIMQQCTSIVVQN